jgi:anti-sigma B factor antagonist
MSLASTDMGETRIVTMKGARIDAAIAIQFKEDMRAATSGAPGRIILDLTAVDFIDSSGLGAIVASMKQLEDTQKLDLAGLSPTVAKVFRLTRMDTVFDVYDTVDAALAAPGA